MVVRPLTRRAPRAIQQPQIIPLIIALLIPALLLSFAAAGSGVLAGDVAITQFVQTHIPDQLAWLFETVNAVGSTFGSIFITATLALLLLGLRQMPAAAIVMLTLPLRASNSLLKAIAESPRPTDALVSVSEQATGFGFPSGHTMGATVLYGTLFLLAPHLTQRRPLRLGIQITVVTMALMTGISRIYVGAHWPSDVLGGYLWATIVLMAGSLAIRPLAAASSSLAQPRFRRPEGLGIVQHRRNAGNVEALAEGD